MYNETAIKDEQNKIKNNKLDPVQCPRCGCFTKYPESRDILNSSSRYRKDQMICNICGTDECVESRNNFEWKID